MKNWPQLAYLIFGLLIVGLYLYISHPLKTFFWGSMGDELFVGANLKNMMSGGYLSDFYYHNLPPFYPPLYFWITGFISHFFTDSAVVAGKIGVSLVIGLWFLIPYFIWRKNRSDWWILILPITSICVLPFQDIITKPYEALSALMCIYWLIYFLLTTNYSLRTSVFYGVTAGLLFMTYYFWWFILIPTTIVLVLFKKSQLISTKLRNLLITGGVGLLTITPYVVPLFYSFYKYGLENWQGKYFRMSELIIWHGFFEVSVVGIILLAGLIGLIYFRKSCEPKILLSLVVAGYIYWVINFIVFKFGGYPAQMLKPFHFLITIALCAGLAFAISSIKINKTVIFVFCLLLLIQNPITTFAFNKDIQLQLQKDLIEPKNIEVIKALQTTTYNLQPITWLSSGTPELNLYLPLKYYLAHNAHFSHSASQFSQRLEKVKSLNLYQSQELCQKLSDLKVTGLILYCESGNCPINVEIDNFPNGGKNIEIPFDEKVIRELNWQKIYDKNGWLVLIKP